MSISEPDKITTPWASTGSKNPIPQNANNTTGAAGFDKGFPDVTMTPEEAGGIPPSGQDFNGIFYQITDVMRYQQAGGKSTFSSQMSAAIGGYNSGFSVLGSDGILYESTIDNNTTAPPGTGWIPVKPQYIMPSSSAVAYSKFSDGDIVFLSDRGFRFKFQTDRNLIQGQPATEMTFNDELHVLVSSGGMLVFFDWHLIPSLQAKNYGKYAAKTLDRTYAINIDVYGDSIPFGQANAGDPNSTNRIGQPTGFGDGSVYEQWQFNDPWPSYLQSAMNSAVLQAVTVRNAGYSGDRVYNGYLRHRVVTNADASVVAYGTNDANYACSNGSSPSGISSSGLYNVGDYAALLYKFVAREVLRGKTVIILGTTPYANATPPSPAAWDGTPWASTRLSVAYDSAAENVAKLIGSAYVDSKQDLLRQFSVADFTNDGVHYKTAGAKIVGNKMAAVLSSPHIGSDRVRSGSVLLANPTMASVYGDSAYGTLPDVSSSAPSWGVNATERSTISLTQNVPLTFSFYAEEDGLVAFLNARSAAGPAAQYTFSLDGGAVQPRVMFSGDYLNGVPVSSKNASTVGRADRDTSNFSSATHPVLLIASKGWHTLAITQTGTINVMVDSISFISTEGLITRDLTGPTTKAVWSSNSLNSASRRVSAIAKTSTGVFDVTFAYPMATADYEVCPTILAANVANMYRVSNKTVSGYRIEFLSGPGTGAGIAFNPYDPSVWSATTLGGR